jgi:hypothetical protein
MKLLGVQRLFLLLSLATVFWAASAEAAQEARVSAAYIDLHSGPGPRYPVLDVALKDEPVWLLKRHTDWYKLRNNRGHEGWIHQDLLAGRVSNASGTPLAIEVRSHSDAANRRWELSFGAGDFAGAALIGTELAWLATPNIKLQFDAAQIMGDFSDGYNMALGVHMYPFPERRLSPFFGLGGGILKTRPQTTVVQADSRSDDLAYVSLGADYYVSGRFLLRFAYRHNLVFTNRDVNEEIREWKAGIGLYF